MRMIPDEKGEKTFREFDSVRTFNDETEALAYAKDNKIKIIKKEDSE